MESKYGIVNRSLLKTNRYSNGGGEVTLNGFAVKRKHPSSAIGQPHHIVKVPKLNGQHRVAANRPNSTTEEYSVPTLPVARTRVDQQRLQLPVTHCRQHLQQMVRNFDTIVLMGETGSGKTTQIPQFLLEMGYSKNGVIGVTQPRRVAAITVAKRVAIEQNCKLGTKVGYTVRFEDCTSESTRIKFVTDGYLLREALADRLLMQYSVLMLDEVHERTINTDVLFGIVKQAQELRRQSELLPLKLILTSATMDIDHFTKYFGVPGMYLEGRTYPVRVMHVREPQSDYLHATLVTFFEIHRNLPLNHDVLIFLTGQEEIESIAQQIRQIAKVGELAALRVFTLYAQLPQNKQLECFLPITSNVRKVVLATNIAETSITIPGIRCVIDCGFVKRRIYHPTTGMDILRIVRISAAQAWQRCGRAGRDAAGICYRTYTLSEMEAFEKMQKPEILRSNISAVVLQLLALKINPETFDFLDRPSTEAITNAYQKLEALSAVVRTSANEFNLTKLGRKMARFPLNPQYSKLLLAASSFGCLDEMLSLVAVLSGENIFVSTSEKAEHAALAHAKFTSKHGDHLTLLNVFKAFLKTDRLKMWCHENFLNARNLMYAREVRNQLQEIACQLKLEINSCGNNYDQVRKCLLVGLQGNIAELQRDNFYLTISGRQRTSIHPSSVFHGKYRPDYVVFTEMVLTERNFIRQVTEIQPEWIAEVLPKYPFLSRIKRAHI